MNADIDAEFAAMMAEDKKLERSPAGPSNDSDMHDKGTHSKNPGTSAHINLKSVSNPQALTGNFEKHISQSKPKGTSAFIEKSPPSFTPHPTMQSSENTNPSQTVAPPDSLPPTYSLAPCDDQFEFVVTTTMSYKETNGKRVLVKKLSKRKVPIGTGQAIVDSFISAASVQLPVAPSRPPTTHISTPSSATTTPNTDMASGGSASVTTTAAKSGAKRPTSAKQTIANATATTTTADNTTTPAASAPLATVPVRVTAVKAKTKASKTVETGSAGAARAAAVAAAVNTMTTIADTTASGGATKAAKPLKTEKASMADREAVNGQTALATAAKRQPKPKTTNAQPRSSSATSSSLPASSTFSSVTLAPPQTPVVSGAPRTTSRTTATTNVHTSIATATSAVGSKTTSAPVVKASAHATVASSAARDTAASLATTLPRTVAPGGGFQSASSMVRVTTAPATKQLACMGPLDSDTGKKSGFRQLAPTSLPKVRKITTPLEKNDNAGKSLSFPKSELPPLSSRAETLAAVLAHTARTASDGAGKYCEGNLPGNPGMEVPGVGVGDPALRSVAAMALRCMVAASEGQEEAGERCGSRGQGAGVVVEQVRQTVAEVESKVKGKTRGKGRGRGKEPSGEELGGRVDNPTGAGIGTGVSQPLRPLLMARACEDLLRHAGMGVVARDLALAALMNMGAGTGMGQSTGKGTGAGADMNAGTGRWDVLRALVLRVDAEGSRTQVDGGHSVGDNETSDKGNKHCSNGGGCGSGTGSGSVDGSVLSRHQGSEDTFATALALVRDARAALEDERRVMREKVEPQRREEKERESTRGSVGGVAGISGIDTSAGIGTGVGVTTHFRRKVVAPPSSSSASTSSPPALPSLSSTSASLPPSPPNSRVRPSAPATVTLSSFKRTRTHAHSSHSGSGSAVSTGAGFSQRACGHGTGIGSATGKGVRSPWLRHNRLLQQLWCAWTATNAHTAISSSPTSSSTTTPVFAAPSLLSLLSSSPSPLPILLLTLPCCIPFTLTQAYTHLARLRFLTYWIVHKHGKSKESGYSGAEKAKDDKDTYFPGKYLCDYAFIPKITKPGNLYRSAKSKNPEISLSEIPKIILRPHACPLDWSDPVLNTLASQLATQVRLQEEETSSDSTHTTTATTAAVAGDVATGKDTGNSTGAVASPTCVARQPPLLRSCLVPFPASGNPAAPASHDHATDPSTQHLRAARVFFALPMRADTPRPLLARKEDGAVPRMSAAAPCEAVNWYRARVGEAGRCVVEERLERMLSEVEGVEKETEGRMTTGGIVEDGVWMCEERERTPWGKLLNDGKDTNSGSLNAASVTSLPRMGPPLPVGGPNVAQTGTGAGTSASTSTAPCKEEEVRALRLACETLTTALSRLAPTLPRAVPLPVLREVDELARKWRGASQQVLEDMLSMGLHGDRVAALVRRRVEEQRVQLRAREVAAKEAQLAQAAAAGADETSGGSEGAVSSTAAPKLSKLVGAAIDTKASASAGVDTGKCPGGLQRAKDDDLDAVTGLSALIEVLGVDARAVGLDTRTGTWKLDE